jgi:hypothetical protein
MQDMEAVVVATVATSHTAEVAGATSKVAVAATMEEVAMVATSSKVDMEEPAGTAKVSQQLPLSLHNARTALSRRMLCTLSLA